MPVELNDEEHRQGAPIATKPAVLHGRGVVFFLIPKVASTSISHELNRFNHTYESRDTVVKDFPEYNYVTIVRNPFDRLVSCWSDKIMNPDAYAGWCRRFENHLPHYQGMPFDEFIRNVCELDEDISDRHFRSQVAQLKYDGKFLPDYVGKVENLQQSLNEIAELTGLPIQQELTQKNRSKHRKKSYKDYYTPELIKLVEKKFEEDLDILGYTFND